MQSSAPMIQSGLKSDNTIYFWLLLCQILPDFSFFTARKSKKWPIKEHNISGRLFSLLDRMFSSSRPQHIARRGFRHQAMIMVSRKDSRGVRGRTDFIEVKRKGPGNGAVKSCFEERRPSVAKHAPAAHIALTHSSNARMHNLDTNTNESILNVKSIQKKPRENLIYIFVFFCAVSLSPYWVLQSSII